MQKKIVINDVFYDISKKLEKLTENKNDWRFYKIVQSTLITIENVYLEAWNYARRIKIRQSSKYLNI